MKKIAIFLLICTIVLYICPQYAHATTWNIGEKKRYNDISYVMLKDGTLGVAGAKTSDNNKAIKIPSTVKGYKVTTIMSHSFVALDHPLKELIIPEGVTTIEEVAFGATINTLSLPASLQNIDDYAFSFQHFSTIKLAPKNPCLILKNNCLINKKTGYMYCYPMDAKATSLILPDEVKKIEDHFWVNPNLTRITLSPNLIQFDFSLFKNVSFIIPKNMTKLPVALSNYLASSKRTPRFLKGLEIEKGNTSFSIEDSALIDNTQNRLLSFIPNDTIKAYTMPDRITTIEDYAFYRCTNLQNIILSPNLTSIGKYAFARCQSIRTIILPDTLLKIGDSAFESAKKLEYINIPVSVIKIGKDLFKDTNQVIVSVDSNSKAYNKLKKTDNIILIDSKSKKQLNLAEETLSPIANDEIAQPTPESLTTKESVKQDASMNYSDYLNLANQLSKLISYPSKQPVSGKTEITTINGRTINVHSDFKYAMDVYYEYFKQYYDSVLRMDYSRMLELVEKAEQIISTMDKISSENLSEGDMAYYLNTYEKILKLVAGIE